MRIPTGRIVLRTGLIVLWVLVCMSVATAAQQAGEYRVLFGWDINGSIDHLARRATVSSRLKDDSAMMISFGGLLGDTRIVRHEEGAYFFGAACRAGIDYVIPGSREFMFGREHILRMAEAPDCPKLASANIVDERTRDPIFEPYIRWEVSGMVICIIPLSDPATIRDAPDATVTGIDVLPYGEAVAGVYDQVLAEYPDAVILAGRLSREDILVHVNRFPRIDMYLTNSQSAGFWEERIVTRSVTLAGRPVYIGTESGNRVGVLEVGTIGGIRTTSFADILLDSSYPPDETFLAELNDTLELLHEYDREDSLVVRTGRAIADTLARMYDADAVFLERESLFHYHMGDSLLAADVPRIVRPGIFLDQFTMPGSLLKSVWTRATETDDPAQRLHFGGMTVDGRIDSIPVQDERDYQVLATSFLRGGGNGFGEFARGGSVARTDIDMPGSLESYLALREEEHRRAMRPKYWQLDLFLTINANYEHTDVNENKALYGDRVPKPFRGMQDTYTGVFLLSSQNNLLTYRRTVGRHRFESELKASYSREGKRKSDNDHITYTDQRNHDPVEQFNKYTYKIEGFPAEPYVDLRFVSVLYSGAGRHPLSATVSTGATKTFPKLLGLNVSAGLQATRDYVIPENDFGTKSTISFDHTFPAKSLFTTETTFRSRTNFFWTPMAKYNMEFKMDSDTNINIQIWKRINAQFTIRAYSYRNSVHKKTAVGLYYNFTLNYGMTWKF